MMDRRYNQSRAAGGAGQHYSQRAKAKHSSDAGAKGFADGASPAGSRRGGLGAFFHKYERGAEDYYQLLRPKIIEEVQYRGFGMLGK